MDTVTDDDVTCSWSLFSDGEDGTFTDADKAVAHFTPETDGGGVPDGQYVALVALHESGHAMGLVPDEAANSAGHNQCKCGRHCMDSGQRRNPPCLLDTRFPHPLVWEPQNEGYLNFILPK